MSSPGARPPNIHTDLASSVETAKAVFFDFDGPLCDVFFGHPAAGVAEALKTVAEKFGVRLPDELGSSKDPHGILKGLRTSRSDLDGPEQQEFFDALEETLARHELQAVNTAKPTTHAVDLTRALHKRGKRLLVTSNNAADAVEAYLHAAKIAVLFDDVVGRDPHDPLLMKPHPHCVNRALKLVRMPPEDCLLIGDQPTDAEAAREAGVHFLGYVPDHVRAEAFKETDQSVSSLKDVLRVLPPLA